jgi:hypothetical protein
VVGAPAEHFFVASSLPAQGAEAVGEGADCDTRGARAPRKGKESGGIAGCSALATNARGRIFAQKLLFHKSTQLPMSQHLTINKLKYILVLTRKKAVFRAFWQENGGSREKNDILFCSFSFSRDFLRCKSLRGSNYQRFRTFQINMPKNLP